MCSLKTRQFFVPPWTNAAFVPPKNTARPSALNCCVRLDSHVLFGFSLCKTSERTESTINTRTFQGICEDLKLRKQYCCIEKSSNVQQSQQLVPQSSTSSSNWTETEQSCKHPVPSKTESFVQEAAEALWLSRWERLESGEVHSPQRLHQGAERVQSVCHLCHATWPLMHKGATHTCMCSRASASPCGAAWPAPAGGCPSACRWRPQAEPCLTPAPPDNSLPLWSS